MFLTMYFLSSILFLPLLKLLAFNWTKWYHVIHILLFIPTIVLLSYYLFFCYARLYYCHYHPFAFYFLQITVLFMNDTQESNRLEYLIPKKTSLRHRLPMGDQGFIDFVAHLLEVNPKKRPSASEALKHPWLSYPYEPISS